MKTCKDCGYSMEYPGNSNDWIVCRKGSWDLDTLSGAVKKDTRACPDYMPVIQDLHHLCYCRRCSFAFSSINSTDQVCSDCEVLGEPL